MSDVSLIQTPDGGDITISNGTIAMDDGLASSVFLSLFGGNWDDSGLAGDKSREWWGNKIESDSDRLARSETQNLLRNIAAIPANLRRIEDAAKRDLAWMDTELSATVTIIVSMPAINQIAIGGSIEINGQKLPFSFNEPWTPNLTATP